MYSLSKALIHSFSGSKPHQPFLLNKSQQLVSIQTIIHSFYAIVLFISIDSLPNWGKYQNVTEIMPLWPVLWLKWFPLQMGIQAILWIQLISSLVAMLIPQWRWTRIALFLCSLEWLALKYSFGKIGHGSHLLLLLSFIWIFLPREWHLINPSKIIRAATLMVFSACQALIMLTYTMSSVGKIIHAIPQALQGEVHSLAPKALSLQIAQRLLETESTSYLGPWLIEHYYAAWLLMLGAIYLQLFALWAAFRPSLHQLWGLGLILFHLGVYFSMTISFEQNCLWLALFFVNSPFRPVRFDWRQILQDLPLIGLLFSKYSKLASI